MSKSIALVVACSLLLTACGQPLQVGDKTYPTYGLFNEATNKSKNVCYQVSIGNVMWSIILVATIVVPVYFVGWSIFNPTRMKTSPDDQCGIDGVQT